MSTIDKRIVQMQFDNAQFERGISQSMDSLDEFNEKLQFKEAMKGIAGLQKEINAVSFIRMQQSVDRLSDYFTTIGGKLKETIKKNITDEIVKAAQSIEQATIGQIKSGGWSRAMNLANAQFMIEGLKLDWNEMLKSINYGVQDTAYGLDAAAKAASSLAASGVDFHESVEGANDSLMHTSLRAISGVAAMTNSTYEDISRIFTSVAGNGRLMGDQLLQLSARGLNVAANLAQVMNTTEADIRDMVSKGKISFEMFATAMDDAFGAHAKEANKTFTGALSNMKAALSRIGAIFATPVIAKTNEVFIAITSRIKEFQKALSDTVDNEGQKVLRFAGHFAEAWETGVETVSKLIKAIDLSWFQDIADAADKAAQKVTGIFKTLDSYIGGYSEELKADAEKTADAMALTAEEYQAVIDVVNQKYGNGGARIKKLTDAGFSEDSRKRIQKWVDAVVKAKYSLDDAEIGGVKFKKAVESVTGSGGAMAEMVKQNKELEKSQQTQKKIKIKSVYNDLSATLASVVRTGKNLLTVIKNLGGSVLKGFLQGLDPSKGAKNLKRFSLSLEKLSEHLVEFSIKTGPTIEKAFEKVGAAVSWVWSKVTGAAASVAEFIANFKKGKKEIEETGTVTEGTSKFMEKFIKVVTNGVNKIKKLPDFFEDLISAIKEKPGVKRLSDQLTKLWDTIKNGAKDALKPAKDAIDSFADGTDEAGESSVDKFANAIDFICTKIADFNDLIPKAIEYVENLFDTISKKAEELYGKAKPHIDKFKKLLKDTFGVENLEDLKASFEKAWDESSVKGILDSVTAFGEAVKTSLLEGLDNVDWDYVGSLSGIALLLVGLLKLMKLTDALTEFTDALTGVPTALKALLEGANDFMAVMSGSIGKMTTAVEIGVITASIVAIGLLVIALGSVDKSKLEQGAAALILIAVFARIVVIGFLNAINNFKALTIAARQGTTFINKLKAQLVTILSSFVSAISACLVILSLAGAALIIVKAMKVFSEIDPNVMSKAVGAVVVIVGAVVALSLIMYLAFKKDTHLDHDMKAAKAMFSLAAVIFALGVAVYAISKACAVLAANKVGWTEVGLVGFLLIVVTAMAGALMTSTATLDAKNILKIAGAILALSVGLSLIVGTIIGLAVVIKLMEVAGVGADTFAFALGTIVAVILALGVAIWLMTTSMDAFTSVKSLAGIIFTMALMILAIAGAMMMIASIGDNMVRAAVIVGVVVPVIALSIGLLMLALKKLADNSGAAGAKKIATMLDSVSMAFIAIGVSLLLIAAACNVMSTASFGGIAVVAGALVLLIGAFFLMAKFLDPAKIEAVSKAFLSIGGMMALVGVGILLIAAALKIIQPLLAPLAVDLANLFNVMAEHPVLVGIFTALIIGLIIALIVFAEKVGPIVKAIVDAITGAVKAIWGVLKTGGEAIGKWFKDLSPKMKIMVSSLIIGLCAALLKASPEVLKTIGKLLFKLLEFLGDIAGKLAYSIVALIVKLIYAITDAITANSGRIASALIGLVMALVDILWNVLGQIIALIFGDKVADKITGFFSGTSAELQDKIQSMRETAEAGDRIKAARLNLLDEEDIEDDIKKIYNEDNANAMKGVGTKLGKGLSTGIGIGSGLTGGGLGSVLGEGLGGGLSDVIAKAGAGSSGGGASWDSMTGSLLGSNDALSGLGLTADGATESMFGSTDALAQLGLTADGTTESMFGSTDALSQFGLTADGTADSLENVSDAMAETAETANEAAEAVDSAKTSVTELPTAAQEAMIKAGQAFRDKDGLFYDLKNFTTDLDNLPAQAKEALIKAGKGIRGEDGIFYALKDQNKEISDFVAGFGKEIGETYVDEETDAMSAGKRYYDAQYENMQYANKAVADNRKEYRDTVDECVNDTGVTIINTADHRYYDAGTNSVAAIVKAVKDGKSDVARAYIDLVNAGIDAYNGPDGQDAHSPSKKYYQNALYSILGITNAINQNEDMATSAMAGLASSMVSSFGSGLSYVGKVASGELAYDPTIRPVLDTSRVSLGASSINGMFNRQSISLSGFSGRLAADIGQLDSRNSDVVGELQALREEMAYMTEEMTNMQMVVDSGALVGAIAPGMDRSLGRMTKFKGRGN